jgi:hypothetical protein
MQLKFRATLVDLLVWNPQLNRSDILNELAEDGEAWIQSGAIAKMVSPEIQ